MKKLFALAVFQFITFFSSSMNLKAVAAEVPTDRILAIYQNPLCPGGEAIKCIPYEGGNCRAYESCLL